MVVEFPWLLMQAAEKFLYRLDRSWMVNGELWKWNVQDHSKDDVVDKMLIKVMKYRPSPGGEGQEDEAE